CWSALILANLGEAYLLTARGREAGEAADSALELSRKHQERGHEAWSLRLLAEVAAYDRRASDAETRFREAIDLGSSLRTRPLVAHCHLGLGKLYRRTREREKAQEHLTTATAMYREMGMTYWLEKAEAAAAEDGG